MAVYIQCQQCQSPMVQTKKVDRNMGLQIIGVVLFLVAIALLFLFPIGTIIGIFLMIGAARLGHSKKKVWKCENCGYFFERA